jgi:hypothetical protein
MLGYLREHDMHFERLRHEYLSRLDEEYRAWRRGEVETPLHRRAAQPTTAASPEPSGVAMPKPLAPRSAQAFPRRANGRALMRWPGVVGTLADGAASRERRDRVDPRARGPKPASARSHHLPSTQRFNGGPSVSNSPSRKHRPHCSPSSQVA